MKRLRIRSKIYFIPMIIVFIAVASIYHWHYKNTIEIIKSEYDTKIKLIEQSIYNETKYTEVISKIAEKDIRRNMEENSKAIIDKYRQNPNVLDWNLTEMKKQFDNMDIYILDKELEIIASSIEEEVGLNLNIYPDFSNLLKERLTGNKFTSDTINFSILEGELKKFSYMPTPDNKYLIELSVTIKEAYPELKNLNIVYLSKDLKDKYPFVADIRVYKFNKDQEYSHELDTKNQEFNKENLFENIDQDKYVKKALETNSAQEQIVKDNHNTYRLKYIPYTSYYENNELTWWKSYVIEIAYNDQMMIEEISNQRKKFLKSMMIILILYFGFVSMVVYLIQKNMEIANNDYLTKLPNRKKFEEVMRYEIAEANTRNTKIAILFFDLDNFKKINDTFGHNTGDKVLKEVASRIKSEIRKGDMVSRLGGDEFIGLISGLNSQEEVIEIIDRMSDLFNDNMDIDSKQIAVKPSIGISIYPDHGNTVEELILKADDAMYEAKQKKMKYKIYENKDI